MEHIIFFSSFYIIPVNSYNCPHFLSVVWSMESMVSHRCLKVHFAFEGSVPVNAINRPKAWPSFKFKVREIRSILGNFLERKVYFESFEANRGTRHIAWSAMEDKWFQSYVAQGQSRWLSNVFEQEALCLWYWISCFFLTVCKRSLVYVVLGFAFNEIFRWKKKIHLIR